jgi:diadenosine tetraphosphate (Ap4A) HIT family hydrolase
MPSVFTRIIDGELPARFVWSDDLCVAFLSHRPLRPGHTLVVPRLEVDHWVDLELELLGHLMGVSHHIGQALQHGFQPLKVGMIIAGLEVPHAHVHLVPFHTMEQLNFAQVDPSPRPEDLDRAAETIRTSLTALGIAPGSA